MKYEACLNCFNLVGWVGVAVNLILAILKICVGLVSGSHALLVSSLYPAKDMVMSLLIIVGEKVSSMPLDREHPYGHGKAIAIFILGACAFLIAITVLLFVYAVIFLMNGGMEQTPHMVAMWAALLAVIINAVLYNYSRCVSIESTNPMIRILAQHYYTDMSATGAVVLGLVVMQFLDMPWLDATIGLFASIHLLMLLGEAAHEAYRGLMDHNAPDAIRTLIMQHAQVVDGVKNVVNLRTRLVGLELWVDLEIGVDSNLTIVQADAVSDRVIVELTHSVPQLREAHISYRPVEVKPAVVETQPTAKATAKTEVTTETEADADTDSEATAENEADAEAKAKADTDDDSVKASPAGQE